VKMWQFATIFFSNLTIVFTVFPYINFTDTCTHSKLLHLTQCALCRLPGKSSDQSEASRTTARRVGPSFNRNTNKSNIIVKIAHFLQNRLAIIITTA